MDDKDLREYADGWITERKHTGVPKFLKLSYIVVASCCVAYLILFMYGETGHADRGPLVREFVRFTGTSEPVMYLIGGLAAVFFAGMIAFAFQKMHED